MFLYGHDISIMCTSVILNLRNWLVVAADMHIPYISFNMRTLSKENSITLVRVS